MYTRETYFVLGAGASVPLGLPSAEQLRLKILNVDLNSLPGSTALFGPEDRALINELRKKYFFATDATIDTFLFHHEKYREVARVLITFLLIKHHDPPAGFAETTDNWYSWLFAKIVNGTKDPNDIYKKTRGKCITFNYDTTLDHFLLKSLTHYFNREPEFFKPFFESWGPHHIHGKLGDWPWNSSSARNLLNDEVSKGSAISAEKIRDIAKGLKFWFEDSPTPEYRYREFENNAAMVFLGFGYHDDNLSKMFTRNLTQPTRWDTPRYLYGTGFNMNTVELEELKRRFSSRMIADPFGSLEFLRRYQSDIAI
jgi:hypothetical protein